MIDLTTVAQAALVLFGAVITTVIVPCVKKNTTVQQQKGNHGLGENRCCGSRTALQGF